jgi:Zn-finger nucleic acid-binding protein
MDATQRLEAVRARTVEIPYCQRCGRAWMDGATVQETETGATYRCKCGAYYRVDGDLLIQQVGNERGKIRLQK